MAGHDDHPAVRRVFQHLVRFAPILAPVLAATIGTQCMNGEAHAYDDVRVEISATKPGHDDPTTREPANSSTQDPSEDLISGLRSLLQSRRSSYGRVPGSLRFRGNAQTSNVLRSVTRTKKNLKRSMRSITNSVRSMNTSINRIRTYRRRF